MAQVTINYGGNSVNVNVADGTSVGSLLGDVNYKAVLGFSGNETAQIDGLEVDTNTVLTCGDELTLVTKAASKA